jgi:magnesium transporter
VITAFLYDAEGEDREVSLLEGLPDLAEQHLLWIDITGREPSELERMQRMLDLDSRTAATLRQKHRTMLLSDYGKYLQFDIACLAITDLADLNIPRVPGSQTIDFVVGEKWFLTVHDEEGFFFKDFREQERGETLIGNLSPAAFVAALLDWHLTVFLDVMTRFQSFVDGLDVRMLSGKPIGNELLAQVVAGRRYVSSLRRMLAPQRTVFYGLSRPDFTLIAASNAVEHFQSLERRFERTLDAIDHGRELMQGSFDLFDTRVAESTNVLIRRLTFVSVMLGVIGAVAGVFGMNFETPYTATGSTGFWIVVGCLGLFIVTSAIFSRWKGWL